MKLRGWHLAAVWAVIITLDLLLLGFVAGFLVAGLRELAYLTHQH